MQLTVEIKKGQDIIRFFLDRLSTIVECAKKIPYWRIPMNKPCETACQDAHQFANVAADSNQPIEKRREAFEKLIPTILQVEACIAQKRQFREILGEEWLDQVLDHVWCHIGNFDGSRGFVCKWLKVVLLNLARDHRRKKLRREPLTHDTWSSLENVHASASPERNENLQHRCQEMQKVISDCRWSTDGKVKYFVLFLFQIRLKLCQKLFKWESREAIPENASMKAEKLFPWSSGDQAKSFRDGDPRICEIWNALNQRIKNIEDLQTENVLQVINSLPNAKDKISVQRWAKWIQRLKTTAQSHIKEVDWNKYFRGLFH